jgi:hypothetical protein
MGSLSNVGFRLFSLSVFSGCLKYRFKRWNNTGLLQSVASLCPQTLRCLKSYILKSQIKYTMYIMHLATGGALDRQIWHCILAFLSIIQNIGMWRFGVWGLKDMVQFDLFYSVSFHVFVSLLCESCVF